MSRLVILVDGIVRALAKRLTPDVTWNLYCKWLRRRRSDLRICHLEQPYDWVDIFSQRAEPYEKLQQDMAFRLAEEIKTGGPVDEVIFLGFSLGGLTALAIASRWEELAGNPPDALSFITFGTPYAGANLFDKLFSKANITYVERMYNLAETKRQARILAGCVMNSRLLVMAHSIANDEMVNEQSARMIADWLYFTPEHPDLQFSSHTFNPGTLLQPHNSLMQNPLLFAYVDGLLDELVPPEAADEVYCPPDNYDIRHLR